jgi:hypothetical protein
MASSFDGVKCSIQNGAVRMHLDDGCVKIPAHVLTKSRFLSDALLSVSDVLVTSDFVVPAPEQWLRAWVAGYVSDEGRLECVDSTDLINCLKVCFFSEVGICHRYHDCFVVGQRLPMLRQWFHSSTAAVHAVSHLNVSQVWSLLTSG